MPEYTVAQKAAIQEIESHLQLIACAGSGKTQVISQRIANILGQPGVLPKNIVAFTFTEKAAAELKERISKLVEEAHGDLPGMAEMYVGTMHGYCLNILQTYVPEAFKYGVLTDITQRLLIDRESTKSGLTTCPSSAPSRPNLWRYADSKLYMQVLALLQEDDVNFELIPDGVQQSLQSYLELLSRKHYFDFTAMIASVVAYLESTEAEAESDPGTAALLRYVKDDIKYVVVDEYQDVNPMQEKLIAGLVSGGANLCVVGDDDQTIYQWRGSEVSNILTFAHRHDSVKTIELAENFRSTQGIVRLGRTIAEWIPNAERLSKSMEYASHQIWEQGDILALEFEDTRAESAWIAQRIEELRGLPFLDSPGSESRGLSWSDMAVLYRTVKDASELVDELRERGIPYIIKGLARLFDSPEVKALVGMFQFMVGEIDDASLRILFDDAQLMSQPGDFAKGISVLRNGADFSQGDRWGTYNIQRLYLEALEAFGIDESSIPGDATRAELVMYQLGKFSQVISDFESINFSSNPESKYKTFVKFLTEPNQAPSYYEDSGEGEGFGMPDAVTITTVHRAKGMQWPAVFTPCLRKNRFPIRASGGLNVFHVVPIESVPNGARYRGGLSEETRLFYVAVTRSQKYLYLTWSPVAGNQQAVNPSEFFLKASKSDWVLTRDAGLKVEGKLTPKPKQDNPAIEISFSEMKYLLECPYQFKLRFMYGFNPPIHEALGYGKGLHDALAEMHKRAMDGDIPTIEEAADLVERHLNTPYAYPQLREQLRNSAIAAIESYFSEHGGDLARTVYSEKQIEVQVASGVTIAGRIDLIKKLETGETAIVDFKSTEDSQRTDLTRDQLSIYALGYQHLTGENADRIQILNLDEKGDNLNEKVDEALLGGIKAKIDKVATSIRSNDFPCGHDHSNQTAYNDLAWLTSGAPVAR